MKLNEPMLVGKLDEMCQPLPDGSIVSFTTITDPGTEQAVKKTKCYIIRRDAEGNRWYWEVDCDSYHDIKVEDGTQPV